MKKLFQSLGVAFFLSSTPLLADEYFAVTPSGATEMLFGEPAMETIGRLSTKCIDAKWSIASSSANELVCEAPLNVGQSMLGTLLMGNSYSTPPRRFFKYAVSMVDGVSRVQATGWMELQMAFGQMRRTDFSGPEFHNGAMNFMGSAGGKLPPGTTFPNHVFLGIELAPVAVGKTVFLRVATVQDGSAAAEAGVQAGDLIATIAKRRLKGGDDFLDATAKAAKTPTYTMDVLRNDRPISFTITRAYRPAITATVVPKPPTSTIVTVANQGNSSVADELAKLGKLKADGLLTQAEFDQQKAKLLAR